MFTSLELAAWVFEFLGKTTNSLTNGALEDIGSQIIQLVQEKTGLKFNSQSKSSDLKKLQSTLYEYIEHDYHFKQALEQLVAEFRKQEIYNHNTQVNQNTNSGRNINISNTGNGTAYVENQNQYLRRDL